MKKVLFILTIAAVLIPSVVWADAARFNLNVSGSGAVLPGGGYEVRALVHKSGSSEISVGENIEFRIKSPRSGDRCDTRSGGTDNNGFAYGGCYATTPGQMTVYAHSNDKNDDSSDVILTFTPRTADTPTPAPSVKPTLSNSRLSPTPEEEETPTPEPTEEVTPSPTPEVQGGLLNNGPFMGLFLIVLIAGIAGGIYYWKTRKTTIKKISHEPDKETDTPPLTD